MPGYSATIRNTRLNAVRDAIDAGSGAGQLKFYDGPQPATGGTVTNELAAGTFSDPSAPDAAGGVLTFNAITVSDATLDGTAVWARVTDSAGTFVGDFSVGVTGSGADFEVNSTDFLAGGSVSVISASITAGNS